MLEHLLEQEYAVDEYQTDIESAVETDPLYGLNRELTGTDSYQNLITLIENQYGDWAYRVLDRYTAQALWSLANEHGAHNALELIQGQDDPTETL